MKKIALLVFSLAALISLSAVEGIPEIVSKLQAYYNSYPQVRVHLVFTQEKYAPGDTAFFKAYFLTEDFRPIEQKQILTMELLDKNGATVQMQNFKVERGTGNNQIVFPPKFSPGKYTVVAYSEYMKNFSPSLFYRQSIDVVGRNELASGTKQELKATIHPEGGRLVVGVSNRLILKSNEPGSGKILNEQGMLVAEFQVGKAGVASVELAPTAGMKYYATLEGLAGNIDLPEATDEGVAMKIIRGEGSNVDLQISAAPNSSLQKQELFLLVTAMGGVVDSSPFEFEGGEPRILNVRNLAEGLNQFTVFDKKDNVVAERIYFVNPKPVFAIIEPSEKEVLTRGVVELEVSLTDNLGRDINGEFSISAINSAVFPENPKLSFENEIVLFGDVPSLREDFYMSGMEEEEWMKSLNDLLVCYPWSRIPWDQVLDPKKQSETIPFKYSLSVSGRAFFQESNDPVPDSTLILIYQQRRMVGYEAYVGKDGRFTFPFIYDFQGSDQVFYMMDFKKKIKETDYRIEPDVTLTTQLPAANEVGDKTDIYGEYKFKKRLIDDSFEFFRSPEKSSRPGLYNPNAEFEDELGGADVSIKVDDYLVFPTMPDLIHEIIPGLQARVASGTPTVRVVFLRNRYTVIPKGDPLYIIDGVFTTNTEFFLNLNPEEVLTIKLVNGEQKLNRFGGMGKFGVVLVQTKKSIREDVIKNSTVFSISGLSEEIKFKAPDYTNSERSRVPDLRSTVHWFPNATVSSNRRAVYKFYASDDATPIKILINGIAEQGKPFSSEQIVTVKAPVIKN